MSLNPSNGISERITGRKPFPNVAGMGKTNPEGVDAILVAELEEAGIEWRKFECLRDNREPHSSVIGCINAWGFQRAWYYWVCEGPGIPPEDAERLHAKHGESVRVNGHCLCPSPLESCKGFAVGLYHVDNQEGLNALAALIRDIYKRAERREEEIVADLRRLAEDLWPEELCNDWGHRGLVIRAFCGALADTYKQGELLTKPKGESHVK